MREEGEAMSELLPCPFCGDRAFTHDFSWHASQFAGHMFEKPYWQVICTGCRAAIGDYDTRAEAIEAWNTRTPEQAIADELNATMGAGECEWMLEHSGVLYDKWKCSACGYLYVESRTDDGATDLDPNYCPHCGFKIRKAVKR